MPEALEDLRTRLRPIFRPRRLPGPEKARGGHEWPGQMGHSPGTVNPDLFTEKNELKVGIFSECVFCIFNPFSE